MEINPLNYVCTIKSVNKKSANIRSRVLEITQSQILSTYCYYVRTNAYSFDCSLVSSNSSENELKRICNVRSLLGTVVFYWCVCIHSFGGVGRRRMAGGLIGFQSARQQLGKQKPQYWSLRLPPWFHIRRSANDDSVQADEGTWKKSCIDYRDVLLITTGWIIRAQGSRLIRQQFREPTKSQQQGESPSFFCWWWGGISRIRYPFRL
jgi:hypothetical protein